MTKNDEALMTKEIRSPNDESFSAERLSFDIRHSLVIRA